MTDTLREVIIRPAVTLPAISTEQPERTFEFLAFLAQFLVTSAGMRKDENLAYLFEWEDAVEKFCAETAKAVEIPEPKPPTSPKLTGDPATDDPAIATFREACAAYVEERKPFDAALLAARVGQKLYISDAAFLAGKAACKDAVEAALVQGPSGASMLPAAWAPKVLRHYHALTMSKAVKANDVPAFAEATAHVAVNGSAQADAAS